jgi:transcriptional regulator with XRE-family HTH domain
MRDFLLSPSLPLLITLATVALGAFLAVWMGHTDRSREEVAILRAVIKGYGWKDAEFADAIGVSEPHLSRIFSGQEALNAHRCADLPLAFRQTWDAAKVAARGGRIYEADEIAFIRDLAALPKKLRMLKMAVPQLQLRREA